MEPSAVVTVQTVTRRALVASGVWVEGKQTLFCDFALALLKGVVEHGDGTAYFGSLLGYEQHLRTAVDRGHVEVVQEMRVVAGFSADLVLCDVVRATGKGLAAYAFERLDALPRDAGHRAVWWRWDVPRAD